MVCPEARNRVDLYEGVGRARVMCVFQVHSVVLVVRNVVLVLLDVDRKNATNIFFTTYLLVVQVMPTCWSGQHVRIVYRTSHLLTALVPRVTGDM